MNNEFVANCFNNCRLAWLDYRYDLKSISGHMSAKGYMTPNQHALMVMAMLDDGFLSIDRSDPPDPDLRGLIDSGFLKQARACKRDFPSFFYEITPVPGLVKTAGGSWEWPIGPQETGAGQAASVGGPHGSIR